MKIVNSVLQEHFCKMLQHQMTIKGYTDFKLNYELGRTVRINDYITKKALPSLPVFVDICKVLETSPDYMLGFIKCNLTNDNSGYWVHKMGYGFTCQNCRNRIPDSDPLAKQIQDNTYIFCPVCGQKNRKKIRLREGI